MSVTLSPQQAQAVAELARATEGVALHQLGADAGTFGGDVYVTPRHRRSGYRVGPDGAVAPVQDMLPAEP
jgi:hypothetical protein